MHFIEVTRRVGSQVPLRVTSINVERIMWFHDDGKGGTKVFFTDKESITITESYSWLKEAVA